MESNPVKGAITGSLIGMIMGCIYYIIPAKLLICGPIPAEIIVLPDGVQAFVIGETLKYGGLAGIIIGLLGGLTTPIDLPRGELTRRIGAVCWLVCGILGWITQGEFIAYTSGGRIVLTILFTIFDIFFLIPLSIMICRLESIRE